MGLHATRKSKLAREEAEAEAGIMMMDYLLVQRIVRQLLSPTSDAIPPSQQLFIHMSSISEEQLSRS
jgi:hypothetical protein